MLYIILSMRAGRANWGFPKRLEKLSWKASSEQLEFWTKNEIYRLRACGPRFSLCAKFFCVQTLECREVRVPMRIAGQLRLAWRGRQLALMVEDFTLQVGQ